MDLVILDTNLRAFRVLDIYNSAIWTDRYYSEGDFEITAQINPEILDYIKLDYYLQNRESSHLMIIEKMLLASDAESGNIITVSGRSLESILRRRIIWGQKTVNGNLQNGIEDLLNDSIVLPQYSNRKVDNFIFSQSADSKITALTIDAQYLGDNLYDVIQKICEDKKIGFRVTVQPPGYNMISAITDRWESGQYDYYTGGKVDAPSRIRLKNLISVMPNTQYHFNTSNWSAAQIVVRAYDKDKNFVINYSVTQTITTPANVYYISITLYNPVNDSGNQYADWITKLSNGTIQPKMTSTKDLFVFELYSGLDRTYEQTERPYVIFSPKFDNIVNSNYTESKMAMKNVALVGGEGEGSARKYATVGTVEGFERREMFIDANDISSDVGNHKILTPAEYTAQLEQRGNETLSQTENKEVKAFDGEIETSLMFKYGVDFFNGDIVQIADEYGNEGKVRVIETIMSEDQNGIAMYPTYEAIE